jgi:hypothetical protein
VRRREAAGQASAEYIALLLVVAAVLAASAVAVPGVGERVVDSVRTALCIVGGDVCRSSDAAAAGLEPCVTRERSTRQETTVDLVVVRLGGDGEWQLALRSDGQAEVTRIEEGELGGVLGVGLTFTPAGVEADASASLVARYHGGRAWRFPDARAAGAFLDAAMRDASVHESRAPDVRWRAIGGRAGAEAELALAFLTRAGLSVSAGSAIGLVSDGARRTLTLDLEAEDPHAAADLPGAPGAPGTLRSWVADVSWEGGALRELALRAATGDGRRLDEYTARLDLRERGNRAVAERLLRPGPPSPEALRGLADRMRTHGVIERHGYSVEERRRGFGVGGRLGVALGLEHYRIASERRLVDAVAWIRGGPPQRRVDCLGV